MSIISKLAEGNVENILVTLKELARMYAIENRLMLDNSDMAEVVTLLMAGFAIQFTQDIFESKEMQNDDA